MANLRMPIIFYDFWVKKTADFNMNKPFAKKKHSIAFTYTVGSV